MAGLFKRYNSIEEYYNIEQRMNIPLWGRLFNSTANGILAGFGKPILHIPTEKKAIDMHVHTYCSYCSFTKPEPLLFRAALLGLSGICIMDHHTFCGYEKTRQKAEELIRQGLLPKDFIVIKGIEYSTLDGHIGGLFCTDDIYFKSCSAQEAIDRIKEMNGIPIAVHPYHKTGVREKLTLLKGLEAVEIFSGSVLKENEYIKGKNISAELARFGSGDSHFLNTCGICVTYFPSAVQTEEDIRYAINNRLTEAAETSYYAKIRRLAGFL